MEIAIKVLNILEEIELKEGIKVKTYDFDEETRKLKVELENGKRFTKTIK